MLDTLTRDTVSSENSTPTTVSKTTVSKYDNKALGLVVTKQTKTLIEGSVHEKPFQATYDTEENVWLLTFDGKEWGVYEQLKNMFEVVSIPERAQFKKSST